MWTWQAGGKECDEPAQVRDGDGRLVAECPNDTEAEVIAALPEVLRELADEFDRYDEAMTKVGRGHEDYGRQRERARRLLAALAAAEVEASGRETDETAHYRGA